MARHDERSLAKPLTVAQVVHGDDWQIDIRQYMSDELGKCPPPNLLGRLDRWMGHTLFPGHPNPLDAFVLLMRDASHAGFIAGGLTTGAATVLSAMGVLSGWMDEIALFAFFVGLVSLGVLAPAHLVLYRYIKLTVRGPAQWRTRNLCVHTVGTDHPQYQRLAVIEHRMRNLLPGARLEISELVQNRRVLDPVIWVVPQTGERHPVLVYDKDGERVLPPAH